MITFLEWEQTLVRTLRDRMPVWHTPPVEITAYPQPAGMSGFADRRYRGFSPQIASITRDGDCGCFAPCLWVCACGRPACASPINPGYPGSWALDISTTKKPSRMSRMAQTRVKPRGVSRI